jgi:hypothetical protein
MKSNAGLENWEENRGNKNICCWRFEMDISLLLIRNITCLSSNPLLRNLRRRHLELLWNATYFIYDQ